MDVTLSIDRAIPLGLILNELLSNALKHAFPKNRKGNLFISLKPIKGDLCELVVQDDGVGFPKHFNFENPKSLGLELVKILIDQIDGAVKLKRKSGGKFVVRFEIK